MFNPQKGTSKMMMPKVDLPAELMKAEQLTALSHPRWGQMFLPTYTKIKAILAAGVIAHPQFCLFQAANTRSRAELEAILGTEYTGVLSSDE